VIYDIIGRVLQQGAEEGEVRDYSAKGKGSARVELTVGREMAARRHEDDEGGGGPVARRGHEAEERKERCAHVADEGEKWEGEEKGGTTVTGHPF
jgi:hypothetical protein